MDHYFCRGCLGAWGRGRVMETCPGCLGHVRAGWTPADLVRVYGPIFEVADRAYFPRLDPPPPRTEQASARPRGLGDLVGARAWLRRCDALPGFRAQQEELLAAWERSPSASAWRRLAADVRAALSPRPLRL